MIEVEFGTLGAANDFRDRVPEYLHDRDDRRTKTVTFRENIPPDLLDRAEQQAYATQDVGRAGQGGMAELSARERQSLKGQHDSFDWQQHGFGAMRAKAALTERGATEWMDFYDPGEGVAGALRSLRRSKQNAAKRGTPIGVKGDFTDMEEMTGGGRRRTQTERVASQRVDSAKEPAFRGDEEALDFLREERRFTEDLFNIVWDDGQPSGADYRELREAHEDRSRRSRETDERLAAPVTRDPLRWASNKDEFDFPGVDTVNPFEDAPFGGER